MTDTRGDAATPAAGGKPTCRAIKAGGARCGTTIGLSADGLCLTHDPARAEVHRGAITRSLEVRREKKEARDAGRPQGMPAQAPRTLHDAVQWSAWAMHAVAVGAIDARTCHEIGYLVNAFKAAVEKRDMERKIAELQRDVDELRAKRKPKIT